MVCAVGGKEGRSVHAFHKDRGNESNIRQMCTAAVRIIDQDAIPWLHLNVLDGVQDGHRHGAEVYGNMLGLGNHVSRAIKSAHEKSLRSLILGEKAVRQSVTPISSAIPLRRFLK